MKGSQSRDRKRGEADYNVEIEDDWGSSGKGEEIGVDDGYFVDLEGSISAVVDNLNVVRHPQVTNLNHMGFG